MMEHILVTIFSFERNSKSLDIFWLLQKNKRFIVKILKNVLVAFNKILQDSPVETYIQVVHVFIHLSQRFDVHQILTRVAVRQIPSCITRNSIGFFGVNFRLPSFRQEENLQNKLNNLFFIKFDQLLLFV